MTKKKTKKRYHILYNILYMKKCPNFDSPKGWSNRADLGYRRANVGYHRSNLCYHRGNLCYQCKFVLSQFGCKNNKYNFSLKQNT